MEQNYLDKYNMLLTGKDDRCSSNPEPLCPSGAIVSDVATNTCHDAEYVFTNPGIEDSGVPGAKHAADEAADKSDGTSACIPIYAQGGLVRPIDYDVLEGMPEGMLEMNWSQRSCSTEQMHADIQLLKEAAVNALFAHGIYSGIYASVMRTINAFLILNHTQVLDILDDALYAHLKGRL